MSRSRLVCIVLTLIGLILFGAVSANAKDGAKGPKPPKHQQARITWSLPRVEQEVAPGQTVEVDLTLTSSADVANVTLQVPRAFGQVVTVQPSTFASLKAGVPTAV